LQKLITIRDKDFFRQCLKYGSSKIVENIEKKTVLKQLKRANLN